MDLRTASAAITILIAAVGLAAAPGPTRAQETPRQITVVGTAEVTAVPDLAVVTAGVETQDPAAAEAFAGTNAAIAAVFAVLEAAGIARPDIQTSQLSLEPIWQPYDNADDTPRVVGFRASNIVTIRVQEVERVGAVIDALTRAGANRIQGISFEIADPRPLLDEARDLAVAEARRKAAALTEAAGARLGPVHSIRETIPSGPALFRSNAEFAADAVVAQGTVGLSAEVEMVFGLD